MKIKKIIKWILIIILALILIISIFFNLNSIKNYVTNTTTSSALFSVTYAFYVWKNRMKNCENINGDKLARDCNTYIENLYESCNDPSLIQDPETKKCLSVRDFKKPLIGCEVKQYCDGKIKYPGYKPYDPGFNPYSLFQLEGNPGSQYIIVFQQGGPSPMLNTDYMKEFEKDFLVAYVQQTNTLKPYIMQSYDITTNDAAKEQEESIGWTNLVYRQLKKDFPNKKFILAGHSMGAFLTPYYLSKYGNTFDKVLIMAGRLHITDQEFINRFSLGQSISYNYYRNTDMYMLQNQSFRIDPIEKYTNKNYVAPKVIPTGTKMVTNYHSAAENNMLAAVGSMNFIELLKDVKLDNLTYVYSSQDEQLDSLSKEELDFLKSKGAFVKDSGMSKAGGHSSMLVPEYTKNIINRLLGR